MTNIEVAKLMVSRMKCLLSREQIHELAEKGRFAVPCFTWKKD